ncbi:trypsin-like peptidase domain-containing protein [Streptomyces sp. JV176]|uniref:trypsin-like peptidase domain-containing protein n=1 Tax=Streptomyces sp. JV176 TaxID=858630 RepID=UPI002E7993CF|nr:trypsin-like peptidase domain-containing protein [Streptomyces sp. JV176]MEE1798637.1 trypsin-like peptidase domain-containing protein [Streptomyces sp. JV176]
MSTENEGTAGPAVPSVPPVPDAAPAGTPASAPREVAREAAPEPADQRPGPTPTGAQPGQAPTQPHPTAPHPAASQPTGPHPAAPQPTGAAPEQPAGAPQQPGQAPPSPYAAPAYPAPEYAAPTPPHGPVPAGASVGTPTAAQPVGAGWPPPPPVLPSYGGGGDGGSWGAPMPGHEPPKPPRGRGGGLIAAVLVAALVAGGVGGGIGYWAAENNDNGGADSTTVSAADTPKEAKRAAGTVASVAAKSLPSVVTIDAKGGNGEGGTGTGFVYDKEGHILTNNHVVASAADGGDLTATFSNGKKYNAEVVGRAEGYDVAVVKLKNAPAGLSPLPLANSEQVAVGDTTIAIGAPFGLSNTVTTGIISAKNRPVASGDGSGSSNSYMSALQTDASINPGNSGGPLLDARGAVIGINSAIQSAGSGGLGQSQAGSIGLGFAIPINQAKNVAEQLIRTGKPVYPVIGATVTMSEASEGATIASQGEGGSPAVSPNGPAAKAGLKAGDVITKFNDLPIDSGPTLIGLIWTHKPGDKVTITYKRAGKESTAQVTLGEREGES